MDKSSYRLTSLVRYLLPVMCVFYLVLAVAVLSSPECTVSAAVLFVPVLLLTLVAGIRLLFAFRVVVTDDFVHVRGSARWRAFDLDAVDRLRVGGPVVHTPQVDTDRLYVVLTDGTSYRASDFGSAPSRAGKRGSVPWIVEQVNADIARRKAMK